LSRPGGRRKEVDNHAGRGLINTGEYLALELPTEELIIRLRGAQEDVVQMRVQLERVIKTVHAAHHGGKGASKRPAEYSADLEGSDSWWDCKFSLCREVKRILMGGDN
jgi:hypothetical protein